jgi:phosphoribosylanthranilate isomerase
VKICGCTSPDEVEGAIEAGADAVGMIFAPSQRRITFAQAVRLAEGVPPMVSLIGVFIDPTERELEEAVETVPRLELQFSGSEEPALCRLAGVPYSKVFHIDPEAGVDMNALRGDVARYEGALPMFETASAVRGGSGRVFDWGSIAELARERRVVVSGGLKPENVGACVRSVRPFGVDVRSGVESDGTKDRAKMRAFVHAVQEADAQA